MKQGCLDAECEVRQQAGGDVASVAAGNTFLPGLAPQLPACQLTELNSLAGQLAADALRRTILDQQAQDQRDNEADEARLCITPKFQAFRQEMDRLADQLAGAFHFETVPNQFLNASEAASWRKDGMPKHPTPETVTSERERMFDDGRVIELGDAEDSPAKTLDQTPDAAFLRRVEEVYKTICLDQTGVMAEADYGEVTAEERKTLKAQSHEVAAKMVLGGIDAYRNDMWNLFVYHLHTRHLEEIPKFRRLCLLPYVAAMVRAQHLRALEHWLQRNKHCRFWTFTSGERCAVEDLADRLTELHGRISDLNAYLKKRGYPAQIVFRSTELGSVETKRGDDEAGAVGRCPKTGVPLYHPHAHCVVWLPDGRLETWQWTAMLEDIWAFWGDNWQDGDEHGGPIRNPKECVKYMFKPGEMAKLSPEELAALHKAIFKKKMVQPMGELALEIRARRKAGLTLVKAPVENGEGSLWCEVKDWNKGRPTTEQERRNKTAASLDSRGGDFTAVMARLVPSFGPLGVKEARLVIATNRKTPDMEKILRVPSVQRLVEETRAAFAAAFIRVHKGTATVSTPFVIPAVAQELARLSTPHPPDLSPAIR